MQEYTERLETNEKKLRQVLKDQASVEQDQVVELRRQLNAEKKRAIEQSEVLSQAKEALERENYKQATAINEKEEHIRSLNKDLRSHERKLQDIQSMFNGGGGAMNASGYLNDTKSIHLRQASQQVPTLGMLNGGTQQYMAHSLNNFSPRAL